EDDALDQNLQRVLPCALEVIREQIDGQMHLLAGRVSGTQQPDPDEEIASEFFGTCARIIEDPAGADLPEHVHHGDEHERDQNPGQRAVDDAAKAVHQTPRSFGPALERSAPAVGCSSTCVPTGTEEESLPTS